MYICISGHRVERSGNVPRLIAYASILHFVTCPYVLQGRRMASGAKKQEWDALAQRLCSVVGVQPCKGRLYLGHHIKVQAGAVVTLASRVRPLLKYDEWNDSRALRCIDLRSSAVASFALGATPEQQSAAVVALAKLILRRAGHPCTASNYALSIGGHGRIRTRRYLLHACGALQTFSPLSPPTAEATSAHPLQPAATAVLDGSLFSKPIASHFHSPSLMAGIALAYACAGMTFPGAASSLQQHTTLSSTPAPVPAPATELVAEAAPGVAASGAAAPTVTPLPVVVAASSGGAAPPMRASAPAGRQRRSNLSTLQQQPCLPEALDLLALSSASLASLPSPEPGSTRSKQPQPAVSQVRTRTSFFNPQRWRSERVILGQGCLSLPLEVTAPRTSASFSRCSLKKWKRVTWAVLLLLLSLLHGLLLSLLVLHPSPFFHTLHALALSLQLVLTCIADSIPHAASRAKRGPYRCWGSRRRFSWSRRRALPRTLLPLQRVIGLCAVLVLLRTATCGVGASDASKRRYRA